MEPSELDLDLVFNKAAEVIKQHLAKNSTRDASVVRFVSPTELLKVLDFALPDEGESPEQILEYVKKVMEYSIQAGQCCAAHQKATEITATVGHPRYFNQLYSGLNETGMIAQMVSAATNTSV